MSRMRVCTGAGPGCVWLPSIYLVLSSRSSCAVCEVAYEGPKRTCSAPSAAACMHACMHGSCGPAGLARPRLGPPLLPVSYMPEHVAMHYIWFTL